MKGFKSTFERYSFWIVILFTSCVLVQHPECIWAAQNLREAAQDLKSQVDGTAPILGGVGVGIGCLLMMVGLGGIGRMIAATGATGFIIYTLWPTLQYLLEQAFRR